MGGASRPDCGRAFRPEQIAVKNGVLRDRRWVKLVPGSTGANRSRPVDTAPKRPARHCTDEGPVDVDVDVDIAVALAVAD